MGQPMRPVHTRIDLLVLIANNYITRNASVSGSGIGEKLICNECPGLFWFDLVLWHINHYRLFNAKSIFIHINSSISNNSA